MEFSPAFDICFLISFHASEVSVENGGFTSYNKKTVEYKLSSFSTVCGCWYLLSLVPVQWLLKWIPWGLYSLWALLAARNWCVFWSVLKNCVYGMISTLNGAVYNAVLPHHFLVVQTLMIQQSEWDLWGFSFLCEIIMHTILRIYVIFFYF